MTRPFLLHLLFMALGYALAVLVSVTIACTVMGLPTVFPDNGNWGSFYAFWRDFPSLFLGGLSITAMYALPGWLITVVIAELRGERRKYWFGAAGVLTALLALFLSSTWIILLSAPAMFFGSLIGGFCGGMAYWAAAGRSSGGWRVPLDARAGQASMDEWALK